MRTFEYKLRPTKIQAKELERLLWETKCLYNMGLEQLINHYKETGKHLNRFAHDRMWNKKTCPQLPAVLVDTTIARLHQSFANFFRGIKQGKRVGFPRFQSYKRWSSFAFRDYKSGGRLVNDRWHLNPKNKIKVIFHRPFEGNPKFTRLVKRADGYYVQVVCEVEKPQKVRTLDKNKAVGIDLGLRYFVADSDGNVVKAPQFFRKSEYKLAKQQRQLSKKQKGGGRRDKARKLVAKTHLKIARQRKDWLHKLSYGYVNKYDYVFMENLNISGMLKNRHLSKSISDASWATFQQFVSYKAEILGKQLVLINPAYTSQICSKCGAIVKKSLSQRTHYCSECLFVEDRDVNAGLNILYLGRVSAFGENSSIERSMNQEALGFNRE